MWAQAGAEIGFRGPPRKERKKERKEESMEKSKDICRSLLAVGYWDRGSDSGGPKQGRIQKLGLGGHLQCLLSLYAQGNIIRQTYRR